jgi:hyperosmotically inducible protein
MDEADDGIDDGWTTTKVKSQLLADRGTRGLNMMIESHADIAHPSGVAAAVALRELSIGIARKSLCVRSVDASRLRIGS